MLELKTTEALSSIDISRLQSWTNTQGDGRVPVNNRDIVKWLSREDSWATNKKELFNIFGGQLILEKPIKIKSGFHHKQLVAEKLLDCKLYQSIKKVHSDKKFAYSITIIIGSGALAANKISCESLPSYREFNPVIEEWGGTRKTIEGMKPYKFLKNLVKLYKKDYPDIDWDSQLEDFRIQHSLINGSEIKGTLCLSIHPMDFATMSDNTYDWGSCMSWDADNGCGSYRSGTLSMLQSKTAVVAYIKGSSQYNITGETFPSEVDFWNSKKWRQLFFIDADAIVGTRHYPFHSSNVTDVAREWLKELCESYYSSTYKTVKNVRFSHFFGKEFLPVENAEIEIEKLYLGNMYNDFARIEDDTIEVSQKIIDNNQNLELKCGEPASCIGCGNHLILDESLFCDECSYYETSLYCADCGESISVEDGFDRISVNGRLENFCLYCSDNNSDERGCGKR